MIEFFNSNLIIALATIITGFGAWIVYLRKKSDDKKNAAKVIWIEIRNAEQNIIKIKECDDLTPMLGTLSVLPSNSWKNFNHLFVDYFDRDELEKINSFYNQCLIIEEQLKRLYEFLSITLIEKNKFIDQKRFELVFKKNNNDSDIKQFEKSIQEVGGNPHRPEPTDPKEKLSKALGIIESITTSTCGIKLKKIGKIK